MSVDVESNSSTTPTTASSWSSTPELPTRTSWTPMSSSFTTASTPLLPSLSTPLPLLPSLSPSPPPSPPSSSPPSTSTSPTMTTTTTAVPTTTIPTTVPTTTTITPIITLTTTTSISVPTTIPTPTSTLPPTITPTSTTTTTTVIPSTTSVVPTTSTPASRSTTPASTYPTPPVVPTLLTSPGPIRSAEAMFTSPMGPVSTFSTTVFISTTNSLGSMTIYAPSFITSTATIMDSGGTPTITTGIFANPTLNPDTSSPFSFFQNKGAVAGVFTLVGLAVISIIIWVILFIRRTQRERDLQQESEIHDWLIERDRLPIDPESGPSSHRSGSDEILAIPMADPNPERHWRTASGLEYNNRRMSIMPDAYHRGQYDNVIEYAPRISQDAYRDLPSPTTPHLNVPPPSAFPLYRDRNSSDGMVETGNGLPMPGVVHRRHSHHSSGSSFDTLLASHHRRNGTLLPGRVSLVLDATNLTNGTASRTPSTDNGSSASASKPSYLPSLTHPNFYVTNSSSRSAELSNGRDDHGSEVNLLDVNGEMKKIYALGDLEVSTTEDGHELQKPVLAVRNLPDAASTLSLS